MSELDGLKAKQDALSNDMSEVKDYLKEISSALNTLARLEERHTNVSATVTRLHSRIDNHEERVRSIEVKVASQLWVERIVWVVVAGIVATAVTVGIK